jgi:O-antigen ligase
MRPARALLFLALHAPLALLLYRAPALATLHAVATVLFGLIWARPPHGLEKAAMVGAYIAGSEVLWRMTGANVFWEAGKYAMAMVFIAAMARTRSLNGPAAPLFYFVLLVPSCLLTVTKTDWHWARSEISFNLSGPFALMVAAWLFSHLRLTWEQVQRIFTAFMGPAVGISAIALFGIATNPELHFGTESNYAASGGFGPNQVASMLGLGALLALLAVVNDRSSFLLRAAFFSLMLLMLTESALTFSRGGLYDAGAGAIVACLFWLGDRRSRGRMGLIAALLLFLAIYMLIPRLNAFTGGALVNRFEDTNLTGRDLLVTNELRAWGENPLFGLGPGQSKGIHVENFRAVAAHAEFTRMLAEHGTLGLISLILLLATAYRNFRRALSAREKAVVASLVCWTFLFMNSYAMRLAAPAFIFGLTAATLSGAAAARRRPGEGSIGRREGSQDSWTSSPPPTPSARVPGLSGAERRRRAGFYSP